MEPNKPMVDLTKIQSPQTQSETNLEKKPTIFYSRLDGNTYITKKGHTCKFENGVYVTDKQEEIDELNELCEIPSNYLISKTEVEVTRSDAKVLKEIGGRSVVGTVSSADLAGMRRS